MIAGSTSDENNPPTAADSRYVLPKPTKSHLLVGNIQATSHGVNYGFWLFKDFLLHEVVKCSLHNLLQFKLDGLNGANIGSAIVLCQAMDVQLPFVHMGDVIVFQVEDLLGVLNNRRGVRRQEELGWLRNPIIGKEGTGLGSVQQRLVRRRKVSCGRLLDRNILRSLFRRERAIFGVLHIDEIHLHLL